ncbi:toprim domain-containing protein [Peribacillus muralis]|uniref:toprim domain-containing protein n=1 Tax=Peribacillus muralis TaxID=264697 RepID=UPI0036734333
MKVRDIEIDVDIYEEIMNYSWRNGRKKGDEFVCCSPFRDEQNPSFSINLETGLWIDFGSSEDYWKKGNLVKLLAWLEDFTTEEAEEMLLDAYGIILDDSDDRDLIINIQKDIEEEPKTFSREELSPYLFRNKTYLAKRGISDEVMKQFIVGYDKEKEAVAFFWMDWRTGKVINVKLRSTKSKVFFYIDGGQQIRNHLFGLYQVIKGGHKEIAVVESEIDCLYLWSLGVPAVALGSSNFSDEQRRKLLLSGVETIILATDNDKAGFRIKKQMERQLIGQVRLKELYLPPYAKDVNDLVPQELLNYLEHAEYCGPSVQIA